MDIQEIPLSMEVEYFLDCAQDSMEITAGCHQTLRLYGDRERLHHIHAAPRGRGWKDRLSICVEFERLADKIIHQLEPERRDVLRDIRAQSVARMVNEHASFCARWEFEETTRGGCETRALPVPRLDLNLEPTPRLRRRLHSPKHIRKVVAEQEMYTLNALLNCMTGLVPEHRAHEGIYQALEADWQRQNDIFRANAAALYNRAEYEEAAFRRMIVMQEGGESPVMSIFRAFEGQKPKLKEAKAFKKKLDKVRKSTRRAAAIAAAVLGASSVSAFAHGESVRIPGQTVDFVVQRGRSIHTKGHGALSIEVCQTGGERLANLCYFEKDAPALDQLVSIALHVNSGEEADLIRIGNLFNLAQNAMAHPVIEERQKQRGERIIDLREMAGQLEVEEDPADVIRDEARRRIYGRARIDEGAWRDRLQRYENETHEIYRDAVAAAALGRQARHPYMRELLAG